MNYLQPHAYIYKTAAIRQFEQQAKDRFDISGFTLMQRAGKAAFDYMLRRFPNCRHISICCGAGNNGGDGYLLARIAHERGLKVKIWQVGNHAALSNDAKRAYDLCLEANIAMSAYTQGTSFNHTDLIVDAICGIGVHDNLREEVISIINAIQATHLPVFAIDIPTGVDADTGKILGKALKATATMTFIGLKIGLLTGEGLNYVGELVLNELQLPPELLGKGQAVAEKIQWSACSKQLPPRTPNWHKGLSGHVLIVGGDVGYSGAVVMAATAALRVGAGLVSVATRVENAYFLNILRPEIMCHGIATMDQLTPLLNKANVVVAGPGIGQSNWAKSLLDKVIASDKSVLIDADGLNLLSRTQKFKQNWILTPHPGEAARLLDQTVADVQTDRLAALQQIIATYGGVVVLKGAGSLVGATDRLPALCTLGNPGMATAGMGDVLSGVIGGLAAQGLSLFDAAKVGVYIHAKAGDAAAKEGERGLLAMDLMPHLRKIVNPSASSEGN